MLNYATRGERIGDAFNYVVLALIAAAMFFPFFYITMISFSSLADFLRSDVIFWPQQWVLDAYRYIFQSHAFRQSLQISIFITIGGTLVNLAFTSTMAYALTRPHFGRRALLLGVIFSMLFSPGLIPSYMVVKELGLINSLWALILPGAISPFNLIVMRQFFLSIPDEVTEAALLDGANEVQIFWKIILPLSKPALAAFALFYAVGHWNSYFSAILYLNDPAKWPIQVVLRQIVILNQPNAALGDTQFMLEHQPPPQTIQMAAIIVATLPILLVYPFLQKHFAKGVMIGSVK
jgi:putative aldouronate transport system permease protein